VLKNKAEPSSLEIQKIYGPVTGGTR